ncbi:MAG: hypothetical protein IIB38_09445, partial [Candidatus Hydrogenedentes bacterium]|nr:hypothetical protein [Candidatus Hydrogenedentota bacterium]
MPVFSPIQTSFNAGIYSPLLHGHINAPRRDSAVADSLNMIPTVQGPVTRRGGTKFVFEVKDSAKQTALMPFEFNVEQAFILEMGDQYMRFYKDNEIITETPLTITGITDASPPVVTAGTHGYTTGDEVFIVGIVGQEVLNQRSYHITVLSSTTFSLQDREDVDIAAPGSAWSSGGTSAKIYEIATNYLQADLFDSDGHFDFHIAQSNDVLYITHHGKKYPLSTLVRTSDTDWSLSEASQTDGPYEAINDTTTLLVPSDTTGTITLSVESADLVTNGTFSTDTDWTKGAGWTIAAGVAIAGNSSTDLEQDITIVVGKTYSVT